jgi:hypothetical protein
LFSASDFSSPVTALIWQSRRFSRAAPASARPSGGAGLSGCASQLGQRFRLEEMEDFARTRRGVGVVGEADDLAGGLEQEAQRRVVLAPFEAGGGVALGLAFDRGEVFASAVLLGLDHAHGVAVDEQHVIGRAGVGGVFAHGDANLPTG